MAELCFSVDDFILFFFEQFQQYSSGHRKRTRQLRAPSLLDSSGFVPHMYTAVYMLAPDAAVFDTSQKKKLIMVLVWGRENAIVVARYDSMIPGTYVQHRAT